MTLTEFLLARIAEDEEAAKSRQRWRVSSDEDVYRAEPEATNEPIAVGPWGGGIGEQAEHIARHDPARVLVECRAKRLRLELADDMEAAGAPATDLHKIEALPYADHEDFRNEWRP